MCIQTEAKALQFQYLREPDVTGKISWEMEELLNCILVNVILKTGEITWVKTMKSWKDAFTQDTQINISVIMPGTEHP